MSRWVPPPRRLLRLAALLGFTSLLARQFNMNSWNSGGVTILWPTDGMLLGVLLLSPRRHWPALAGVALLVDIFVNLSIVGSPSIAVYFGLCNLGETLLAGLLLERTIAPNPDLSRPRQLASFLLWGVIFSTAITAVAASLGMSGRFTAPSLEGALHWFLGDALGMATTTPLYLALRRGQFPYRRWPEAVGMLAVLLGVAFLVFRQTRYPLLFLVMPFLLLLGLRLGMECSALGLLMVAVVGGLLTMAGRGPLTLMRSRSLINKDLVFQFFILMSMLVLYAIDSLMAESRRLQVRLGESEKRFRMLAEASSDIIVLSDLEGRRKYVSPAVHELTGWRPEDVLGRTFREIVHPDDVGLVEKAVQTALAGGVTRSVEYRCRKANGDYLWLEVNPRLYRDTESGDPFGLVYVSRDISDRRAEDDDLRRAFEDAERQASSDALTGIANRRYFDEVLDREWRRASRERRMLSLLLMDVDRFKLYNDLYGHLQGDDCLRQIAAGLKTVVRRPEDVLARYGGEEFVAVLPNTGTEAAHSLAESIRRSVEELRIDHPGSLPYQVITLSVGCASMIPLERSSCLDIMEAADAALYRAKSEGRNCVVPADPYGKGVRSFVPG